MNNLFLILFLLSGLCLVVGLIKPSVVIRWGDPEKRSRRQVLITYISIAVVSFFAFGVTTDKKNVAQSQQTSQPATTQQAKQPEQPQVKTYKSGQYKVGKDLPAGEYVAVSKGDAYIELAKDAKGTLDSILANDIFINRSIITVSDGQFIKIQNCELYAFKDAPKAPIQNGSLPSGMYKVGVDLPAGEYKVLSEGGDSYIETSTTSSHQLDDIISNDLFQGDKYINVSNGQYLKFFRAKVQIK